MRPAEPVAAFSETLANLIAGVIVKTLGPEARWTGNLVFACLCLVSGGFATWPWRGTAAGAWVRAWAASLPGPVFLLMPSLHFTALIDLHTDSPAMLLLSLALLAALSERWGLYAAAGRPVGLDPSPGATMGP